MKTFFTIIAVLGATLLPALAEAPQPLPNLYWAPENVTVGGKQVDFLLNIIFWLTAFVFIATQAVYVYYLIKYRRRPGVKAHYSHGNNVLEVVWTTIPTAIFLGLAIFSNRIWFNIHSEPPADALKVNISSYQFGWDMRYPGEDGKLGSIEVADITPDNKFGVPASDAAGKDDFTSTELVIPAGRPVHIYLNSRDVIHSFYVPQFRLYQDAVPGRTISWVWFEVIRPGNFELACSQLCGQGHFNMKAPIKVLPQKEFDEWYQGKVKAAAQARAEKEAESLQVVRANLPATP